VETYEKWAGRIKQGNRGWQTSPAVHNALFASTAAQSNSAVFGEAYCRGCQSQWWAEL